MIGKAGSQITELQEMSGCRIVVKRSDSTDAAAYVEVAGETEKKKNTRKIKKMPGCRLAVKGGDESDNTAVAGEPGLELLVYEALTY